MTGGKPIIFVVIHPDGDIDQHQEPLSVEALQDIVGGTFEAMQPPDKDITIFVNEDGKRLGLNVNWIATSLARTLLRPNDFIVGKAAVTGPPDEEGDVQSLPDEAQLAIKHLKEDK